MELNTQRLILRPFVKEDFDAVHAYASDINNVRYMIWGPNGEKDTRAFIEDCLCKAEESPRLNYDFAITLKGAGRLIGGCGIYLNKEGTEGMLGWILHRDYWKQGYMPEAAKALLRFGFETLKLHRVYATCNADNYGSWRVMEKCGMRREAHFRKNRFGRVGTEQVWYDELHYAMLDEEWAAPEGLRVCRIMHGSAEYKAELALRDRILRKPLGLNLFEEDLSDEAGDVHLGAFEGGKLAGVLVLTRADERSVRMRQVAVDEDRQRGGVGKALVAAAEREAAVLGYARMTLHARQTAVGFYERLGYTAVGEPFTEVGIPHRAMDKALV